MSESEPVHILLVEDNPGDIRLTEEAFKEQNIKNELHVTTNGAKALDFLHRRNGFEDAPRPDIILLDLNLPRMNGNEVLSRIREDEDELIKNVPVIVLTSSQAEEDVIQSYELQANAFLTKPVDPIEFIDTIRTFRAFWLEIVRLPSGEV